MKTTAEDRTTREMKTLRKRLHWAARDLVWSFGWVRRDELVQEVKNIFLWHTYKVETSRALTLEQLKDAFHKIKKMSREHTFIHLEARKFCDYETEIQQLTTKQKNRLIKVMAYVIKMSFDEQVAYIEKTLNKPMSIDQLTRSEANLLIQRVEQWETKLILKK
ncbi:MAG: hypothetical protein DYG97_10180 [Ignavibacteria bacterium CHB3]|nr:hypothetical protein [Ignavibacteria bacterium CHB3]